MLTKPVQQYIQEYTNIDKIINKYSTLNKIYDYCQGQRVNALK